MSNLVIEKEKLDNRLYRAVYNIITNEYADGNLAVHNSQYTMYAYFFVQHSIQNLIRLQVDNLQKDILMHQFQFQCMQKFLL